MNTVRGSIAAACACALTLAAAAPARSQEVSLGLEMGVSVATLRAEQEDRLNFGTGLTAGATVDWRATNALSFGSGLHWVRKGAEGTWIGFEEPLAVDLRLDYLEIPLLARIALPGNHAVRPSLFAGPSVAFEMGCDVRTAASELALTLGCDGPEEERAAIDWSVLLGGALTYDTGSASLRLQGRYGLGLTRIDKASDVQFPNLKNRAFLFTTGLAMAVGS
jgi:hypothetical protein